MPAAPASSSSIPDFSSPTRYLPDLIPRSETPPRTDAEWAEVLQEYGSDRDESVPNGYAPSGSSSRLVPRRGLEGSDASDDEVDVSGESLRHKRKQAFGIAALIAHPPTHVAETEDWASGDAERRRLREYYAKEGWLPGPKPGQKTRQRRRRVIRRLGLAGNPEEDLERKAIMAQYAELAQQMFSTACAGVAILRDDIEYKYTTDPNAEPMMLLAEETCINHALIHPYEQCTVIGDATKDWRTKNNPVVKTKGMKFLASAPLRYLRRDPPVDFGTLAVFDYEARESFTRREQDMLLKLANMLVYQLATLQSEAVAEKTSHMFEESLGFLRRSVMPQHLRTGKMSKKEKEKEKDREKEKRKGELPKSLRLKGTGSRRRSSAPEPDLPPLVVKTGPKETRDAKRRALLDDTELFDDAADTLRGILGADAIAIVKMEDYQLYFRRSDSLEPDVSSTSESHENPLFGFLQGKPWPEAYEPVVHHVPAPGAPPVSLLGTSADPDTVFHFSRPGTEDILRQQLLTYIKTKRFWWDKHDEDNELSQRLVALMPDQSQTLLVHVFFTFDGRVRFATFASWNRPPETFVDASTLALPFVYVMGGITAAATSIRKIRGMEQSQISYSNLQAHELRTPLHQILAITQLLRSSMVDLADAPRDCSSYQNSVQQIRDLLPILDAIDTSGKTLHGIVDNILSFLDLKARDYLQPDSPRLFDSPSGGPRTLGSMFEEVIHEACEENERSRRAMLQPLNSIETVFEMTPPELGEETTEDAGGALRKALAKILSNAYKFIEGEGCVTITVKDTPGFLPPQGCELMCSSRRISIEIKDNGLGMNEAFVRDHLGEPWAKQDPFTTGSGLSVHLAYRVIDLMGGHMEISSAPGRGCVVNLEVPVLRRSPLIPLTPVPTTPLDPNVIAPTPPSEPKQRKIALVGFNRSDKKQSGLPELGETLKRQYTKLGCEIVSIPEAELIIANGDVEEMETGKLLMEGARTDEIIFLVQPGHEPSPDVLNEAKRYSRTVRRIPKPVTPSVIRQTLGRHRTHVGFPTSLAAVQRDRESGPRSSISSTPEPSSKEVPTPGTPNPGAPAQKVVKDEDYFRKRPGLFGGFSQLWKPKGMCPEEAIACLSLGDYFSSRRRGTLHRTPSTGSSGRNSSIGDDSSTPATSHSGLFDPPRDNGFSTPVTPNEPEPEPTPEPPRIKVLVVEDNMINRKILVRILSTKLPIDICEAQDGIEAVEQFKQFSGPSIVLLDINMPRMDGYQACAEMRSIERHDPSRPRSQIIAVTALSSEEEKRHGLVECGLDNWWVKPVSKANITKIVEDARGELLGLKPEEVHRPEEPRRHTM